MFMISVIAIVTTLFYIEKLCAPRILLSISKYIRGIVLYMSMIAFVAIVTVYHSFTTVYQYICCRNSDT